MVQSMTGYGRGLAENDSMKILVEMKTVNHRFLDIQFKMPRQFLSMEDSLKKVITNIIKRGRVDVFVTLEGDASLNKTFSVDWSLMDEYVNLLNQMKDRYGITKEMKLRDLKNEEIISISQIPIEQERLNELLLCAVNDAVNNLTEMRKKEGFSLKEDLLNNNEMLANVLQDVKKIAPETTKNHFEKLRTRLEELVGQNVEETRLITEAAIFAERVDVNEEITRLESHMEQFIQTLQEETVGRKLDFIIQEMNRETNTIGSKCNDAQMSKLVVSMKSIIEKMKEQVQNIE